MHTLTTSSISRLLLLLLLLATGFSSLAQSITGPDIIYVNTTRTPNGVTTNYGALNGGAPGFSGAPLGSYALGTTNGDEPLYFQGGQLTTSEPTSSNPNVRFSAAQLYYRVYVRNNVGNTGFTSLNLAESTTTVNADGTTTRVFSLNSVTTNIDLVAAVSAAGNFTVEIFLQATYQDANGNMQIVKDDLNTLNYQAGFTVTGTRANTTTWMGGRSDNWFDAANWSSGIPTATRDAFIRYPNPGATVPYPKIYANGQYQMSGTSNPSYPYTGETYGNAVMQSLSFGGTSATSRATLELVSGNLLIYGDLVNNFDNITQDVGTTITFAGSANTDITGGGNFRTVNIAGGGTKSLTGNMKISTELHFGSSIVSGLGILAVTGGSSNNVVTLQPTTTTTVARISNETDYGYVSGLVNTQITATPGIPQDFGNIGVTLTFVGNSPGQVAINRTVGQYYTGANTANPNSVSIKRSFEINPADPNTTAGGLNATLVFNYLDNERSNVGANNATVSESQLYLAYSNNSTSFSAAGITTGRDQTNNTVTTSNVTSFAIFTLADTQNPLPVSLVAFNAKRVGDAALITWETAMERNNKGFNVEVSTDGVTFRSLGFVASNSPDSNTRLSYSYSDTEANKSGIRYYRLHQIDLNGQDDYSPVRAVSFAAAGDVAALSAYPNPFTSDEIKLALQSSEAGQATLHLTDLMGRQISTQTFAAVKGVTEVSIDQASTLAAGSYMAQITAPTGEVKTVRIQKR